MWLCLSIETRVEMLAVLLTGLLIMRARMVLVRVVMMLLVTD